MPRQSREKSGTGIYQMIIGTVPLIGDNLNYPREVQFTNGNRIQYIYSPDGQKLRATWQTAVANIVVPLNSTVNLSSSQISSTTRTDYIGNVIYTGTASSSSASVKLSKYLFEGGYATVTPTTQPKFHYFTKDHLGNNRAVVNQSGTVEQITHYYPFGGFFADQGTNSSLQPYKYNGKELDRMHGLDLYDYGFRQYDPVVPMFTQQDPMAEKYYHLSPYVYCGNNPVKYIDKEGRKLVLFHNNSLDFNNQYLNAISYLKEHGCSSIINYLENSKIEIIIKENGPKDQNYTYRPLDKNEIGWKAREGLLTNNGNKLSPAIRLFHELVHQEHKLKNPDKFLKDTEPNNSLYQNKDDESIIKNEETTAAQSCGEIPKNMVSREDHGGIPFNTSSSTSRMILNPSNDVIIWQRTWEDEE